MNYVRQSVIAAIILIQAHLLHAGSPVWTFAPLTATTISVPTNGTALIQYRVTNQSRKQHKLELTPIRGITQVTTAGNCSSPFVLNYKQSCILTLEVSGALLTGSIVGGPVVCQQGSRLSCYQPSLANSLNIRRSSNFSLTSGTYADNNGFFYPLLATNNGTAWNYTIDSSTPSLPPDFSAPNGGAEFYTVTCNNSVCISAGQYWANNTNKYPLLAQSTTNGTTWNYSITSSTPSLPSDFGNAGSLISASCNDTICIAGGSYDDSLITYPLLAQSTNNGTTWSYTINSSTPTLPNDFTNGFNSFQSTSCNASICIVAGAYVSNATSYPLLAQSTNNGATWNYSIDSSTPSLPSDFNTGFINNASCSSTICIAAGYYIDNGGDRYPLLAQSTNNGGTWSYTIDSSTPSLPPDFADLATFNGTSCSDGFCIAVGTYRDNNINYPLLAQSTNNGAWSYTIDSTTPTLPSNFDSTGVFISASCSASICIATGFYADSSNNQYPLVAQSTNKGATWSYSITSSTPNLPGNFVTGSFINAGCKTGICMALGSYFDGSNIQYPLLAQSTNNGATWSYTINSSTPTLPSDFANSGSLNSSSINISSFLSQSLKFLYPKYRSQRAPNPRL